MSMTKRHLESLPEAEQNEILGKLPDDEWTNSAENESNETLTPQELLREIMWLEIDADFNEADCEGEKAITNGAANTAQARQDYAWLLNLAAEHGLAELIPPAGARPGWRAFDRAAKAGVENLLKAKPELHDKIAAVYQRRSGLI
jgi:hypothetical protein